jgi:hypothetical protein
MLDDLIPFGAFAMVSWIFYLVVDGLRRWHQQRTLGQFQAKLLDKIGTVNELGEFLGTDAGGRFLKGMTSEATSGPQARILRAVQSGVVLTALGIGLYAYGWFTPTIPHDAINAINAVATILFALGVGFLASAGLSYRLSRHMGLINGHEDRLTGRAVPTA